MNNLLKWKTFENWVKIILSVTDSFPKLHTQKNARFFHLTLKTTRH